MIEVCSMETSPTLPWSLNAVPLPCFAECRWGGCNGHVNRDRGPQRQFKFQICSLARWIRSLLFRPCIERRSVWESTRCRSLHVPDLLIINVCLYRGIYTGIEKPRFFSHSGLSLEVARQLPLNSAKNPNWETHLRIFFFETLPLFHCFFASTKLTLAPLSPGFIHVLCDLPNTLRSEAVWSRTWAPLTKKSDWDSGFFVCMCFSCQTPRKVFFFFFASVMGLMIHVVGLYDFEAFTCQNLT